MQFPKQIEEKILKLYKSFSVSKISKQRECLTSRYKTQSGKSKSLINGKSDSLVYAVSRMPATFVVLSTLLDTLVIQGAIKNVDSVIDVGAGTGAGFFAVKNSLKVEEISMFERDLFMAEVAEQLTEQKVTRFDILKDKSEQNADLVLSSYVLSEMTDVDRELAVKNLAKLSSNYLLLIDTGTPKTYEDYRRLIPVLENLGFCLLAPCKHKNCELKNDYCQFYARVERSHILKVSKQASLPYEDEKYFYLLFSKLDNEVKTNKRVIRRPKILQNKTELVFCSADGVKREQFSKSDKDSYKLAKKIKINEEW